MLERFFTDHGWHGLHGFWFISNQQPDGSRQIRFVVDLPANQLGPGWRECNTVGGLWRQARTHCQLRTPSTAAFPATSVADLCSEGKS